MKYPQVYALLLMLIFYTFCKGQNNTDIPKENIRSVNKDTVTYTGPNRITRNIIQDRKGNIWIAAFDGIFRYNGKSFTNITSKISSARFFSVLEDSKGNLWFGSIGAGVYYYDVRLPARAGSDGNDGVGQDKSFQNFTTRDGLLNNDVGSMYEDKKGNMWFGIFGGASRYDGKSFRNFIIDGDAMHEDHTGKTFANRPPFEVNAIVEDKTGKLWFATRGNTFVYDNKTFTVFSHEGKPFKNVRSIIEDKKGNIWLGGADGLWRYDGSTFTNFTQQFVGYIMEDKKGNIWTSSESNTSKGWALSRYEGKSLSAKKPTVTEIANKPMFFGILEAKDESIWFGAFDGVYSYDARLNDKVGQGKNITDFKSAAGQQ